MNETRFIKSVAFGGYDKADADAHIKALYTRIAELESKLRTADFLLEKYQNGSETDILNDEILGKERSALAECQAENKALNDKVDSLVNENQSMSEEIESLKLSLAELEQNLADADTKLVAMSQKDDAAVFGAVFASAKKSASEIVENAQKKAQDLEADSKKLADNIIAKANNKAADIVYDAEVYASEMTAEVSEEKLQAVSGNVKALLLDDVNSFVEKMSSFRKLFNDFLESGSKILEKSEIMLSETRDTLIQGGVPVFKNMEEFAPDLPDKPVYEPVDYSYNGAVREDAPPADEIDDDTTVADNGRNFDDYDYDDVPDFDELEEVDIIDDEDDDFDLSGLVRNTPASKGGVSLDSLDRQAEEFMGTKKAQNKPPAENKKSSSMNLADLAAMADALDDEEDSDNNSGKSKSGSLNLDDLAAMADALDD